MYSAIASANRAIEAYAADAQRLDKKKTPLGPVEHRALRESCADRVCCTAHRPVEDEIGHKAEEQMGLWPDRTVARNAAASASFGTKSVTV